MQRQGGSRPAEERALTAEIVCLAGQCGCYGYGRITPLLGRLQCPRTSRTWESAWVHGGGDGSPSLGLPLFYKTQRRQE